MAERKKRSTAALVGAGSLLDLAGVATYRAARKRRSQRTSGWESDWNMVGKDLRQALKKADRSAKSSTAQ